ncbi:16S rRNA (cytosine(967)-C(5))-methyltransferase RsmB [soil metagenome]
MTDAATLPRRAALDVLRRVRAGELADRALDAAAGGLSPRDRAWVQELVYGTLRLRGRIDHLLGALVRGGIDALEPDVLEVLRLGAYQLLEMGSVPHYAAISQSQELVRAAGVGRAAGLVGGVLHALHRRHAEIAFPDPERDPLGYLSSWGSHPVWLVERWIRRWGADEAAALVEANNRRPELYIRPLGIGVEDAAARLAEAGIGAETVAFSPDSLQISPPAEVRQVLAAVPAVVQDPAATLVVRYAAVPPGATVLDLCAAPGGKALALAESAGYVVAADVAPTRLARVRENAARVELEGGVAPVAADARRPPFRPAEVVLLDAPCTGTGTIRRHPDGRWRLHPGDLDALTRLQRELLDAAAPLVQPGGWLVYSTCALEPEENELQVESFLERHPEFTPDPAAGAVDPALLDARGQLLVLPQRTGADGSFAARLRRRS